MKKSIFLATSLLASGLMSTHIEIHIDKQAIKEEIEEKKRVKNALLENPYAPITNNDPIIAESSRARNAISAQPEPGTPALNDSTAPAAVIQSHTDKSTSNSKSAAKKKEKIPANPTNNENGSK